MSESIKVCWQRFFKAFDKKERKQKYEVPRELRSTRRRRVRQFITEPAALAAADVRRPRSDNRTGNESRTRHAAHTPCYATRRRIFSRPLFLRPATVIIRRFVTPRCRRLTSNHASAEESASLTSFRTCSSTSFDAGTNDRWRLATFIRHFYSPPCRADYAHALIDARNKSKWGSAQKGSVGYRHNATTHTPEASAVVSCITHTSTRITIDLLALYLLRVSGSASEYAELQTSRSV